VPSDVAPQVMAFGFGRRTRRRGLIFEAGSR